MRIFTTPEEIRAQCAQWRREGRSLALVPTMGYYHQGHESLMARGRELADKLVVSLFVNPAQFGPNEDLDAYPRDFERDCAIAEAHNVDAIFAPRPEDMYRPDHATWVEVPELARGLCGKSRPIHFRGVCTVVLKLLLLTLPDFALFGQKDWQQQAIIRRMVRDLNLETEIVAMPIVREPDGLALSSRNVYLTPDERAKAPAIREGLLLASRLAKRGETDVARVKNAVRAYWAGHLPESKIDYLEIVDPESLAPLEKIAGPALMACAVFLGKARLIDNILLMN